MITVFNRKELFVTFHLSEQARIRTILADNDIDYFIRTINRLSPSPISGGSRGRTDTLGQDLSLMYQYTIYVHRSDYEKARFLIGG